MDFPSLPSKAGHQACLAFTWVVGVRKSVLKLVLKHFTTEHLANPSDLFWTMVKPAQSWGLRGGTTAQHSHCSALCQEPLAWMESSPTSLVYRENIKLPLRALGKCHRTFLRVTHTLFLFLWETGETKENHSLLMAAVLLHWAAVAISESRAL